jgi:uncharacterized protein
MRRPWLSKDSRTTDSLRAAYALVATFSLSIAGCGSAQDINEFSLREITMPNGATVRAESLRNPLDMGRGAMFRRSMPDDRGLLFEYAKPGNYKFWTYRVEIPLDTIWMDRSRRVVEIIANMQPCPSKSARECPQYGANEQSMFVLQLNAGLAAKYGARVGSVLTF